MIVHAVLNAGIALRIGSREPVEHDGGAIGHDDAVPDQEDPALPVGDLAVVLAEQPGSLRDQKGASRDGVVDGLGDGGDAPTRQVRVQTGDHSRR